VQFWSAQANGCELPGCTTATVTLPGGTSEVTTTIDYTYDPLYRLTNADYSTGDSYQYAYDSVGNRLTQESFVHGLSSSVTYNYDVANRLTDADGVPYAYDDNGNLLSDGVNTYVYDSANRLTSVNGTGSYTYNGLGDRLSQDGVNYTLDLNAGLTQVLSDGTTSYTYGLGRISQQGESTPEYFLGDALGSVRQLVNNAGDVTLGKSYDPYGNVIQSSGNGQSTYGFTGETSDANGLIYLRARYYNPAQGRFFQQDPWDGDSNIPATLNPYLYGFNNPLRYTDPSGKNPLAAVLAIAGVMGLGVAAGQLYGYCSYTWAMAGKCGCDAQKDAESLGKENWIRMHALMGGIAAIAMPVLAYAAEAHYAAAIIIGAGSLSYSVWDTAKLRDVVYKEGAGWNPCTISRAVMDLSFAIFGTKNLISGLSRWAASGMALSLGGA
jgi:RHS repeat-associated protein